MGIPVMIVGESGSGKSSSMRNFDEADIGIFNVSGKPLPFRKKLPSAKFASYTTIIDKIKEGGKKSFVIDDSQYLMANESFRRVDEKGYKKWTDIAVNFNALIDTVLMSAEDTIVYFLHHLETDQNGKNKAKTLGKMLDNQLTVEGKFPIVLFSFAKDGEYYFVTNSDGTTTAKSPIGMFDSSKIDNDIKIVDATIRSYYEI